MLCGSPCVYFSPLTFLAKPWIWLQAISEWGNRDGFHYVSTAAPPFALDLTVKSLSRAPQQAKQKWDFSPVISLILGAEPIQSGPILRFCTCFSSYGLRAEVIIPAYGLAQNVLHVRGKPDNVERVVIRVTREALEQHGRIELVDEAEMEAAGNDAELAVQSRVLVSCGTVRCPLTTSSADGDEVESTRLPHLARCPSLPPPGPPPLLPLLCRSSSFPPMRPARRVDR